MEPIDRLSGLTTIPKKLGEPFYKHGVPVPATKHCLGAVSASKLFNNQTKEYIEDDPLFNHEEFIFLAEYIQYYVNAPCYQFFDPRIDEEIKDRASTIGNIEDLLNVVLLCLEIELVIF
ncbi:MAG: hypothetical protein PHX80_04445 [Candidatus Nanoarchaeia archaeon]|nr:hypothetical protein [Candidatus Nanoarchaeia archaeon]